MRGGGFLITSHHQKNHGINFSSYHIIRYRKYKHNENKDYTYGFISLGFA